MGVAGQGRRGKKGYHESRRSKMRNEGDGGFLVQWWDVQDPRVLVLSEGKNIGNWRNDDI